MNVFIYTTANSTEENKIYFTNISTAINSNKNFNLQIINESFSDNVDYNTSFIIYPEFVKGNPLNFKNVIRFFLNSANKDTYETFESNDIMLFKNKDLLSTIFNNVNVYHPDIIDYYNDDLNNNSIIFDINNSLIENIKNFEDILMKRISFQNVRFTDPIINLFNKDGVQYNIIDTDVATNVISIELDFVINSYNFDYENFFDLNYGSLNGGPRLEINNKGILSLIVGNNFEDYEGAILNNSYNISLHKINSVKIVLNKNVVTYNVNNNIGAFNIKNNSFSIKKIAISGGFNDDRVLKNGTIFNFKIYNYEIPILKELDYYLPNFDTLYLQYPRKVLTCLCKYESLIINYRQIFNSLTFRFILNLKKDGAYEIINMQNLVIYKENNKLLIRLNNKTYLLFSNINLNKAYNIIISINLQNNLICMSINNFFNSITMQNNFDSITVEHNIYVNLFLENLSISNYNMNNYLTFNNCDINKMVNYYNTFGFLKIDNFFISTNESMIKAYSFNVLHNSKNITDYIPRAMEKVPYFVNVIINKKIHCILEKLFNSKYTYTGSDSKIYNSNTNWHCDRKTKNHYLKCCFYLDNLNENTGCLRVLPGSQNSTDTFNNILSKKSIPLFLGPGGFDNNFLNDNDLPYYPININFGDFVVFNLALYHSAFGNHINKKMICMNFCESYTDNNDPEKLEAINSDFGIIGNLSKNLDLSKNIIAYDDNFYKYTLIDNDSYTKMFKDHIENNNSLDKYIRIMLDKNNNQTELTEFINNNNNTNIKKSNIDIIVNNSRI
jgi:hypothetical protein